MNFRFFCMDGARSIMFCHPVHNTWFRLSEWDVDALYDGRTEGRIKIEEEKSLSDLFEYAFTIKERRLYDRTSPTQCWEWSIFKCQLTEILNSMYFLPSALIYIVLEYCEWWKWEFNETLQCGYHECTVSTLDGRYFAFSSQPRSFPGYASSIDVCLTNPEDLELENPKKSIFLQQIPRVLDIQNNLIYFITCDEIRYFNIIETYYSEMIEMLEGNKRTDDRTETLLKLPSLPISEEEEYNPYPYPKRGGNGLKIDQDYIYFTFYPSHLVHIYSKNGNGSPIKITEYGTISSGENNHQFNNPKGLTTNKNYLYVCDSDNHRIQVLCKFTGKYMFTFEKTLFPKFEFPEVIHLSFDEFYIGSENSVQVFTKKGQFSRCIEAREKFFRVSSIWSLNDRLYINTHERLHIFRRVYIDDSI